MLPIPGAALRSLGPRARAAGRAASTSIPRTGSISSIGTATAITTTTTHTTSTSSLDVASVTGLSRAPWKKALLVGVAVSEADPETADPSKVLMAHSDVKKIKEALLNQCGYQEKDIEVMVDSDDSLSHLRPTRQNLIRKLKHLTKNAKAGDKFFFFYAGHGEQRPCLSGSESDGLDEYITCERGKSIKDNRLRELLVDRLPAGAQLFALFDTCHAGTMLDLPYTARARVFSIFFVVGRLRCVVAGVRVRVAAATASGLSSGLGREAQVEVDVQVEVVQSGMTALGVEVDVSTAAWHSAGGRGHRRRRSSFSTAGSSTGGPGAPRPRVLALSSTADDEESWESNEGGPLASAFASVVATCIASGTLTPDKLLREFQRVLAAKRMERVASVDAWLERNSVQIAPRGTARATGDDDVIREWVDWMTSAQRPQLSSLVASDMDTPFSF